MCSCKKHNAAITWVWLKHAIQLVDVLQAEILQSDIVDAVLVEPGYDVVAQLYELLEIITPVYSIYISESFAYLRTFFR